VNDSGLVQIKVLPVNDPPTAIGQEINAVEETVVSITLKGSDIDNDPLTYQIQAYPKSGVIQINNNTVDYIPGQNFAGTDQFTFTAMDPYDSISLPATVQINVHNTNDEPVAHSGIFTMKKGRDVSWDCKLRRC
jgi:hypothetical protein